MSTSANMSPLPSPGGNGMPSNDQLKMLGSNNALQDYLAASGIGPGTSSAPAVSRVQSGLNR